MMPAVLLQLGEAGADEPILGGVIIFGLAGLALGYLAFVRPEMESGWFMKVTAVVFVLLAILSYVWPARPW